MANRDRQNRRPAFRLETLETKNLLSGLTAAPTLNIRLDPPHVTRFPHGTGEYSIAQPTPITVYGTAQPGAPNSIVRVLIFAEDANGNLANGGQPLGTITPDVLGRYSGQVRLPSTIRKDVNYLVAYEEALSRVNTDIALNPTTLSGLTGTVALDGTSVSGLTGDLALNGASVTGLTGTVTTGPTALTGLTATSVNGGAITQTNSATLAGSTGALAQTGAAAVTGSTGTLAQTGAAAVAPSAGTFTQSGTAVIAGTTGVSTSVTPDVSVSLPVTIHVHQPPRHAVAHPAHVAHPAAAVHAAPHPRIVVLVARVGGRH